MPLQFKFLLMIILGLTVIPDCHSQIPEGYPVPGKTDLPEAKFSPSRIFSGTSLFGYIDGGAELYLEYGFSGAVVTEISIGNRKFKTEIFKMTGPEEAFGIFSVSKYRCTSMPEVAEFSCQTKYQLQFCKGPYYVSIINSTGTGADSVTMLQLGRMISDKIKDPGLDLSGFLPGTSREAAGKNGILVKGRLGIVNGLPELEDFFQGTTGYKSFIMTGTDKNVISVKFAGDEQFRRFLELHHWDAWNLSGSGIKSASGEIVRQVAENHLIIELPK